MWERTRMRLPGARGEVWTEAPADEARARRLRARRGLAGADRGEPAPSRRGAGVPALGRRPVGRGGVPQRRGRVRVDPKAGRRPGRLRRPRRRAPLAGGGARGGGRVGRLPPAPHGLELVRRRRPHQRRALGRLEPGQRHQRPAGALRAGDLGGRRAVRARPGRVRGPGGDRLRRRRAARVRAASASGASSRTCCSSATRTGSRSAASRARSRAGSSSSAASASWSTTTPTGSAGRAELRAAPGRLARAGRLLEGLVAASRSDPRGDGRAHRASTSRARASTGAAAARPRRRCAHHRNTRSPEPRDVLDLRSGSPARTAGTSLANHVAHGASCRVAARPDRISPRGPWVDHGHVLGIGLHRPPRSRVRSRPRTGRRSDLRTGIRDSPTLGSIPRATGPPAAGREAGLSPDRRSPTCQRQGGSSRREVVVVAAGQRLERDQAGFVRLEQRRRGMVGDLRRAGASGHASPADSRAGRASR